MIWCSWIFSWHTFGGFPQNLLFPELLFPLGMDGEMLEGQEKPPWRGMWDIAQNPGLLTGNCQKSCWIHFFQQKPPHFHPKRKKNPPKEIELLSTAGSPCWPGFVQINPAVKSGIRPSGAWKYLRVYGPCKEPELQELPGAGNAPERARFSSRLSGKALGSCGSAVPASIPVPGQEGG